MLNGDMLTDIDLTAQLAQHERTGAAGTLALCPVEDPSSYGLVRLNDDGTVHGLRREAVARPDRHEQHLRRRVRARALGARPARRRARTSRSSATSSRGWSATGSTATSPSGYWMDIGTPRALPRGHVRHPRGQRRDRGAGAAGRELPGGVDAGVETDGRVIPPALVERGVQDRGRARRSAAASCSSRRRHGRRRHASIERPSCCEGAEIGADCRCATASSAQASGSATTATISGWRRARRGRDRRRRQRRAQRCAALPGRDAA